MFKGCAKATVQSSAQSAAVCALSICIDSGLAARTVAAHKDRICAGLQRPGRGLQAASSLVLSSGLPSSWPESSLVLPRTYAAGGGRWHELQLETPADVIPSSTEGAGSLVSSSNGSAGTLAASRPLQGALQKAMAAGNWRRVATLTEQLLLAGALPQEALSDGLIKGALFIRQRTRNTGHLIVRAAIRLHGT